MLAIGFAAGWVGLLLVKYYIVGIAEWDTELHPERLAADTGDTEDC